ncbi:hypothetical protein HUU51_01300 [Candidatus Gracilibacteria bacterium]|nr:hypothetical protein [Candidatus Gracilibacteria bacterium]
MLNKIKSVFKKGDVKIVTTFKTYIKDFFFSLFSFIISFVLTFYLEQNIFTSETTIISFFFPIFYISIYYFFNIIFKIYNGSKKSLIYFFIFLSLVLIIFSFTIYSVFFYRGPIIAHKPIIYLYPEQKQEVKVELEVEGKLIADYPRYDEEIKGWEVTAYPDSTIIEDEKEYSYLFWEAEFENNDWDLSSGFVVEGKDAREFLQEKLSYIGLTPKEYNEFIVYWYPKMMNNKYNLVYFAGLDYTSKAPLNIIPEPDSLLRVFTVIKPLKEKIDIQEQVLERFDRKGFSVVEWGGTILE